MRKDEIADSGKLLGETLADANATAREVHGAIARRVFGLLGRGAAPVRAIHDGIAGTVYGAVDLGVRNVPATVTAGLAAVQAPVDESLHDGRRGHAALNALGGWMGDRLAAQRSSLAPRMGLRTVSGVLRVVPENLAHDAGPAATEQVAVLLHGLGETDRQWGSWDDGALRDSYADVLQRHGWTVVLASYNTGLPIRSNGALLAGYLDRALAAWPVPVRQVALVGHSMGGLVAHAAADLATREQQAWAPALSHLVGLGSPFRGAPLERLARAGGRLLERVPETRPFARLLDRRSAGIKDLRDGIDTPPVPGVEYYNVTATLTARPTGPLGHDLLVTHASACGPLRDERVLHLRGRHHFHLLGDPAVAEQLVGWLGRPSAPETVTAQG